MKCTAAEFHNFRNLREVSIEFPNGVTVLSGENAQGKTNIIEGIYLFARGRSFRAAKDSELVLFGEKDMSIKLKYELELSPFGTQNQKGELSFVFQSGKSSETDSEPARRAFFKDKIKAERTSDIIGNFRAVLFCPENLSLINDGPALRRSFIDIALSQLKPVYIAFLSRYARILRERNSLLKSARDGAMTPSMIIDTLDVYSEQLARISASIAKMRSDYINRLDECVKQYFDAMTNQREEVKIRYRCGCGEGSYDDEDYIYSKFLDMLGSHVEREIRYGSTLFGIHRDEIDITVNGKPARLYGSQGQRRSVALAMKLAEGEISKADTGEYPVFLLDDVLSELDLRRRSFILSELRDRQVIVTSCEDELFSSVAGVNIIRVSNGNTIND